MVQRSKPEHRRLFRYVIAVVLGALLIYAVSRTVPEQTETGANLSQHHGTAIQGGVAIEGQTPLAEDSSVPEPNSSSPEPNTSSSVNKARLHVVIAHYEEDPFYIRTWLDDLRTLAYVKSLGLHITVYTKGSSNPAQIKATTAADEVVQLPNTGREGGTYLYHILKHFEDPPPFTLFTQAYLKKAQQEGSGAKAGHLVDWLLDRLKHKFDDSTGFMSLDRKHDICYCGHCVDIKKDFYPLWPQLYTLVTGKVCRQKQPTIMSFNGHFIVSRRRILALPRHMYEYLQELVDAPEDHWIHTEEEPKWFDKQKGKSNPSNPKFGHTLERLWHTLFACDSVDVVEDCEIDAMKAEGKGGCMCRDPGD